MFCIIAAVLELLFRYSDYSNISFKSVTLQNVLVLSTSSLTAVSLGAGQFILVPATKAVLTALAAAETATTVLVAASSQLKIFFF